MQLCARQVRARAESTGGCRRQIHHYIYYIVHVIQCNTWKHGLVVLKSVVGHVIVVNAPFVAGLFGYQ